MTEHPEELLAAYVDGDLDAADRRAVDRHVRSCATCRSEVEMARRARQALASLPEVPAPEGTAFRVLREARRPATGTAWRVATAAGVAASLVLGGIVLFQRTDLFGGGEGSPAGQEGAADSAPAMGEQDEAQEAAGTAAGAPEALSAARGALPRFRVASMRYEPEDMPGVLNRLQREANQLVLSDQRATETAFQSAVDTDERTTAAALECASSAIRTATAIEDPGVPFVFEKASFFDEFAGEYVPGYVAAYLKAPSPDQAPTSLLMTVIDRESCDRLLYYAEPVEL